MTAVLLGTVLLAGVTSVHELGHWLAIRAKRGRVLRVQIGWGPRLWTHERRGTEVVLALLPFGGRIDYEGVESGTGQIVVAVSGAAANLAFSFAAFALVFGVLEVDPLPWVGTQPETLRSAAQSVGRWFWIVPAALIELVGTGAAPELTRGLAAVVRLLMDGGLGSLLYAGAALSALWGAMNLIPVPFLRTDGWLAAGAAWSVVRRRRG